MKKKILALSLALSMFLALPLSGCSAKTSTDVSSNKTSSDQATTSSDAVAPARQAGQFPLTDKPVTLKFACVRTPMHIVGYEEKPVLADFEKKSNVNIEWEEIDSSAVQEKVNLMFSSNQLPDAFYGPLLTDSQVMSFSQTGSIKPLNDLIASDAPNMAKIISSRNDYKKAITAPDGNIYSLANMFEEERTLASANLFMNKAWLDKLSLPVPTTSEEFYTALKAFADKDPNGNSKKDEIPLSVIDKDNYSLYGLSGMFGIPDNSTHLAVDNGKVIYTAVQDSYKESIKYFNRLYSDGLIDSEMFTQDTTQRKAKGSNTPPIIGATICFWLDDVIAKEQQAEYVHVLPMKGPKGDQNWSRELYMSGLSKNTFAITSACKNPEIAMRWADYWQDGGTNVITIAQGEKDKLWGYEDEAAGTWRSWNEKVPEGMIYGQWRHSSVPGGQSFSVLLKELTQKRVLDDANKAQDERYKSISKYVIPAEAVIPPMYFAPEEQQTVSTLSTDLKSFTDQKRAEWITKGGIDKDWDSYIKQLEQLQLSKMLEAYQKTFDNFSK